MNKKQAMARIDIVIGNVKNAIVANTNRKSVFSTGLAGEGYKGGYLDALRDVSLLLNDVIPNRNFWWDEE